MANVVEMTPTNLAESAPGPRTAEPTPQGKVLVVDDEQAIW